MFIIEFLLNKIWKIDAKVSIQKKDLGYYLNQTNFGKWRKS